MGRSGLRLCALVGVVTLSGCTGGKAPPAVAATPRPAGVTFFAGDPFPATFTVPAKSPPALPSDPLSRGALVYQPCPNDDCAPYLLLADGRQFVLGAAPATGGPRP